MIMFTPPPPPPKPVPITIFVHGTQMHALFEDIDMRGALPPVSQTPSGLMSVSELSEHHLVRNFMHSLSESDSIQFPFAGMYAFGWSGGIQVKERCVAGKKLFQMISALSKEYEELHGVTPPITLIAHSHGCNVVLHMAKYLPENESLRIARTLLLACPVQDRTSKYVDSQLFEKIYSIHSHDDHVQIIDQGSLQTFRTMVERWKKDRKIDFSLWREKVTKNKWKLGSDRHFATRKNLLQMHIIWDTEPNHDPSKVEKGLMFELAMYRVQHLFSLKKRGVMHTEFTTHSFFKKIPLLLKELDAEWAKKGTPSLCFEYSIAGS